MGDEEDEVSGEEKIVRGKENVVTGEDVIVRGEENVVTGENVIVRSEENVVSDEEKIVRGEENEVSDENVIVRGEENEVTGKNVIVRGEENVVSGEENVVSGEEVVARGRSGGRGTSRWLASSRLKPRLGGTGAKAPRDLRGLQPLVCRAGAAGRELHLPAQTPPRLLASPAPRAPVGPLHPFPGKRCPSGVPGRRRRAVSESPPRRGQRSSGRPAGRSRHRRPRPGCPPVRAPTTGRPHAAASANEIPNPSTSRSVSRVRPRYTFPIE